MTLECCQHLRGTVQVDQACLHLLQKRLLGSNSVMLPIFVVSWSSYWWELCRQGPIAIFCFEHDPSVNAPHPGVTWPFSRSVEFRHPRSSGCAALPAEPLVHGSMEWAELRLVSFPFGPSSVGVLEISCLSGCTRCSCSFLHFGGAGLQGVPLLQRTCPTPDLQAAMKRSQSLSPVKHWKWSSCKAGRCQK